jgi:AhpD family alkylhydroperoxidase|tara:strand:+ start:142 stop:549 length:408 start_codon:yes stop_codon:yes gene_type:complete
VSTVKLIEYNMASDEVKSVYDDIMSVRKSDWVNNFWKALANQPRLLKDTWNTIKSVMAPGSIDPLTKEMVYIAISASNSCNYCTNSHTAAARAKGMTDEMLMELMAIVGMANKTNALANGLQIEIDEPYKNGGLQ